MLAYKMIMMISKVDFLYPRWLTFLQGHVAEWSNWTIDSVESQTKGAQKREKSRIREVAVRLLEPTSDKINIAQI